MITNLHRLVYLSEKFPRKSFIKKLFEQYRGDDWRYYIEYSKEIKLTPRLFLVGLHNDQRYNIKEDSVVHFLEDTYIPYPTFHIYNDNSNNSNYIKCLYQTIVFKEESTIHSKDYTSFLLWKGKCDGKKESKEGNKIFEKTLISY